MVRHIVSAQANLPGKGNDPLDSRVEGAFGEFVGMTPAEIQLSFNKELVNKIAWVIGSAYKKRYSGKNSSVTGYARLVVKAIIRDHGYQI